MAAYLKTRLFLYHETLAPTGRLFEGSNDVPVPHPGDGWQDSPEGFEPQAAPSVDIVLAATGEAAELAIENERLTEQLADAIRRAVAAEDEAAKVADLVEQLNTANQVVADQNDEITALKVEVAKFDKDGDGKAGGGKKAPAKPADGPDAT